MKIRILKAISGLFFLILITALLQKQVFLYPAYRNLSEKNRIRIRSIDAPRGLIVDRFGEVLAENKISFEVSLVAQELKNKEVTFRLLSQILELSESRLEKNYKKNYQSPFVPVVVASGISKEKAIRLEEKSFSLPGVIVNTNPVRFYPLGAAAAHIIGYVGEISSVELSKLKPYGYKVQELIGKDGIEKNYNPYLKGEQGGVQVEVDNRGRQIRIIGFKNPEKGRDIQLTIDARLQEKIYQLIKDDQAAVTVMDPNTGEILAMVSAPSYDPNIFVSAKDNNEILSLLNDVSHPFLNRNIQATYPPGSLFKIPVSLAALEEKKIDIKTSFECTGVFSLGRGRFACWNEDGHGFQTVTEALKHSCNVFFYSTGLLLGVDLIQKYAKEFGFSEKTGIDLPHETEGFVPDSSWKRQKFGESWFEGETVIFAIGQGYLTVTPLQCLRVVCITANGGKLIRPFLAKRIGDVSVSKIYFKELSLNKKNLEIVKNGLEQVTKEGGTAFRIAIDGLDIAGKTATAQVNSGTSHAWFAGFAPADSPKAGVIVLMEHGGKGGLKAVDVAREIFLFIKENYDLK